MREGFSAIFGNRTEKQRLINSITENALPHALMIVGDEGSGKRTMAREIAMALNCEKKSDENSPLPCRKCINCPRILENKFTDVKTLSRSEKKATVGVEEVRLFKEDMFLTASESEYKVYIFEDADALTPQAQNALLIALEEPFDNVISILLVSSTDKILSTIKSRAREITLERFSPDVLSEYFLKNSFAAREMAKAEPHKFRGIMMSAMGSLGTAERLLNPDSASENEEKRDAVVKILTALSASGSHLELHRAISGLPRARGELKPIFEDIILAIRDLTAVKHSSDAPLIFFTSIDEAELLSHKFNQKKLLSIYDIIASLVEDIDRNANVTAMLTALAVKIKNC